VNTVADPPGALRIGAAPSRISTQVKQGALTAILGLVLFLALVIGGIRASRSRRAAHDAAGAARVLPPLVVDAEGVEWHQL
jgi:hypothetical protein